MPERRRPWNPSRRRQQVYFSTHVLPREQGDIEDWNFGLQGRGDDISSSADYLQSLTKTEEGVK